MTCGPWLLPLWVTPSLSSNHVRNGGGSEGDTKRLTHEIPFVTMIVTTPIVEAADVRSHWAVFITL